MPISNIILYLLQNVTVNMNFPSNSDWDATVQVRKEVCVLFFKLQAFQKAQILDHENSKNTKKGENL